MDEEKVSNISPVSPMDPSPTLIIDKGKGKDTGLASETHSEREK